RIVQSDVAVGSASDRHARRQELKARSDVRPRLDRQHELEAQAGHRERCAHQPAPCGVINTIKYTGPSPPRTAWPAISYFPPGNGISLRATSETEPRIREISSARFF